MLGLFLVAVIFSWQAQLDAMIVRHAESEHVPVALARALVMAESGGNPNAVSRAGAVGLTQLMRGTALIYGVRNRRDPEANLRAGFRHLHCLRVRLGSWRLAVAAYNCGERAVKRAGGKVPRIAETLRHVARVCGADRCVD